MSTEETELLALIRQGMCIQLAYILREKAESKSKMQDLLNGLVRQTINNNRKLGASYKPEHT